MLNKCLWHGCHGQAYKDVYTASYLICISPPLKLAELYG